jgi:non-homologous end joining protein Ku
MRNTLAKSEVITEPSEYFKLLFDYKKEINMINFVSEDSVRVVYKDKKEYVEEHNSSNIVCLTQ